MQTFLPYPSFSRSARVLDMRRLGKQRVEAKQILAILLDETDRKGWRNHPAVKMWKGHTGSLARYGAEMCREWIRRGYKDSLLPYFEARINNSCDPRWIGNKDFHAAHKSNLLRKNVDFYSKRFKDIKDKNPNLPYVWPVS